ncbi:hypothetical protein GALMADRAFT_144736 [Galerina marginata CBS 339.88]|uniref:Uncharacterized protein n=1 Tax=Galerina marginata (strain CBS 339.88) TaxID=685588 RepID=A0A067SHQ6_GALM3|nr:hypothetical protein GALMADRAFT_144736 [Galerina marginata CBS 339.88]
MRFGRQNGHDQPLYHGNPDPTIVITSETHPLVLGESERVTAVQPVQANAAANPSLSPHAKAGLSAFQYTLDVLGKIPVPGIGAVTAALSQVVKSIQEMPQVEAGWKALAERLARLSLLLREIAAAPELQSEMEQYCTPLNNELGQLSQDIEQASKQGKLVRFLNSTDAITSLSAHQKKLDSIVNDLTAALCMNTALTKVELRAHLDEVVSSLHEMFSGASPSSNEAAIRMTENTMGKLIFISIRFILDLSESP